jgi:4-amino-4-deoxy-L-arabinose transferase-like glycosyltransferase
VTVAFSLVVAIVLFRWARDLYGDAAGLVALALYMLSPNIIAHSRLITTDVFALGMILISMYCFWRFLKFGGWRNAVLSAFMVGLSQLAKYVAIFLFPVFLIIVILRYAPRLSRAISDRDAAGLGRDFRRFAGYAVFFSGDSQDMPCFS